MCLLFIVFNQKCMHLLKVTQHNHIWYVVVVVVAASHLLYLVLIQSVYRSNAHKMSFLKID